MEAYFKGKKELFKGLTLHIDLNIGRYIEPKDMYDGYHFTPNSVGIYNPFSLLNVIPDRLSYNQGSRQGIQHIYSWLP